MTAIDDAYEKYRTERFALPSEERVRELERQIEATLPDDYRRFVLE